MDETLGDRPERKRCAEIAGRSHRSVSRRVGGFEPMVCRCPHMRERYHDGALESAADLYGADRLAEASSVSAVVGARRSAVGVGKVGESRLVDAEIAGAG